MLQNRVDPMGNIIRTAARGAWMGNRGVLHNDQQEIVRFFKLHAWITCLLEFKGRWRAVMAPKRYTSLFFLDEATSFAAGHRPCAECRRHDYDQFKKLWVQANPEFGFSTKTRIADIDAVLHEERTASHKPRITHEERLNQLPDGTFVLLHQHPFLLYQKQLYSWSPSGYAEPIAIPENGKFFILTPKSIVRTFRAGYKPELAFGRIPDK